MTRPHISDLQLEELALKTLPRSEERALLTALENDKEAQARFASIEKGDDELLREFTPDAVEAEVKRRLRILEEEVATSPPTRRRFNVVGPRLVLGALAASISIAVLLVVFSPADEETPGYRIKGESLLLVHRITKESAEQLTEGAPVCEGDRIQLSVVPAGRRYAVVVSVDGSGQVTVHFPLEGNDGEIAQTDAPYSLPNSYELDDAPLFERFILITAQTPLDPAHIEERLRRLARNRDWLASAPIEGLPEDTSQSSFLLKKVKQ
ncbi:MAG: DUF4384 domain-containing protein [Deltaproteobacteria bacterium]|nr:DUF4384 domain-containing protein [Deltaproteobacteria bacterium]